LQLEFFDVPSPCIGICKSNDKGQCIGCYRTRTERLTWLNLDSEEKQKIIKRTFQRMKRNFHSSIDLDSAFLKAESANFQISKETQNKIKFFFSNSEKSEAAFNEELKDASSKTIIALMWLLKNVFLTIFLSCIATLIMDSVKEANNSLNQVNSKDELKSKIKKINKEYLADYRAVKVSLLNIRQEKIKNQKLLEL
jgi:predicted Fe-S protein YdhL (DUF1289 family)